MTEVHQGNKPLTQDAFLETLPKLFEVSNAQNKTLNLRLKRCIKHDGVTKPAELDAHSNPHSDISKMAESKQLKKQYKANKKTYKLLVMATVGKGTHRTKCVTVVDASELDAFWKRTVSVTKSSMSGLIKKKTKKKKKGKKN
ncbi:Signal recognition particle subunit SRP14 [Kluyveromyces marxianus]|nr:hypothetical protein C6P43_002763 [Kluyveromyces marxianus]KAG0682868.1 hypothetical protein C6P41_003462 [Kluyveromyces marxianus]